MNKDFYYFFNLFKDDNDFNDALNTVRYRYGINPLDFQHTYSQYNTEWDKLENIVKDKLRIYIDSENLTPKEQILLFSLIKVISDSRHTLCRLESERLSDIYEIQSDLLYLLIKLVLQLSVKEFAALTVRCTKVIDLTSKKIDSKTNTQLFKNSFLHHIFSDSEKICKNTSLPIRVLFAPVQFAALKTINICPYKYIYDCRDIKNDARFNRLTSISDSQSASLMLSKLVEDFGCQERHRDDNQDMYTRFSLANLNTFCKEFSEAFSEVVAKWNKFSPETVLPHRINALRIINDYITERVYHFGFYQQFNAFLDDKLDEYQLDYNQLLSIATLDNVFFCEHLLNKVAKKENATGLYHTSEYGKLLSSQAVDRDLTMMACRESVDLLNYIYYPTIFTLSFSLVGQNNFSLCEIMNLLDKLSSIRVFKKRLNSIDVSKYRKSTFLSPSNRNRKDIEGIIDDSVYIINRRYYSNTPPYTYYYLHTFSGADSPLVYPPDLIPAILPPPEHLDSDEGTKLRNQEIVDRKKTTPDEATFINTPEKNKADNA